MLECAHAYDYAEDLEADLQQGFLNAETENFNKGINSLVLVIRSEDVKYDEMLETLCFTVRDWACKSFSCMTRMIRYDQLEEYLCWAFIQESKTFAKKHCKPKVWKRKDECYY